MEYSRWRMYRIIRALGPEGVTVGIWSVGIVGFDPVPLIQVIVRWTGESYVTMWDDVWLFGTNLRPRRLGYRWEMRR